jgi:hypothetical protein
VLRGVFGERVGAEALLRAYLAEIDGKAQAARFWTDVFLGLAPAAARRAPAGAEHSPGPAVPTDPNPEPEERP